MSTPEDTELLEAIITAARTLGYLLDIAWERERAVPGIHTLDDSDTYVGSVYSQLPNFIEMWENELAGGTWPA